MPRQVELPVAVSTRLLVMGPVLALTALVCGVFAQTLPRRAVEHEADVRHAPASAVKEAGASARGSTEADLRAYEQALGLRRAQASLEHLARELRDERRSSAELQKSLDDARQSAKGGKDEVASGVELPATAPQTKEAREELAKRVDEAAAVAARKAAAVENGKGAGTVDGGGGVKDGGATGSSMEPAPAYAPRRFEDASAALSDQSSSRRALAQAAVESLARIKKGP
jgi:hypothetical protein